MRSWQRGRLVVVALALALLGAGCRSLLGGDGLVPGGSGNDGGDRPTPEEFLADAEAYLAALRDGDLDAAWERVCHEGFGASDPDVFTAHHADGPRPTSWDLSYQESGSGSGRSSSPGGGGGTPSGAAGTVELSDGSRGEVRLLYGDAGLCQVIGDEAVVDAVDPSPDG